MAEIQPLHRPRWQPDGDDWLMIVGNRTVAALQYFEHGVGSSHGWYLSYILACEVDEGGWSNVDFTSLGCAQHHLEQWWHHAIRGAAYRP
jgi:hypothetical protein